MIEAQAGIVAVILAAGRGVRLGGPKALLWTAPDGEPLVAAQCRDLLQNGAFRAIAVVRQDVAEIVAPHLVGASAELLVSRALDEDGPAGSLAAAAAHLGNASFQAAIVTPVDVRVRPSTVRALVDASHEPLIEAPPAVHETLMETPFEATPAVHETLMEAPSEAITAVHETLMEAPSAAPASPRSLAVVPRFAGRRGHPVLLSASVLARYREASPPPLRDHLRAMGERVRVLDVDDPWILEDLDFAHQTAALLRFTGGGAPRFVTGPGGRPT